MVDVDEYISYVSRGQSLWYAKIRNDTFRTFPGDAKFKARVSEASMVRVLNAFCHYAEDNNSK